MNADDTKCHPDADGGVSPGQSRGQNPETRMKNCGREDDGPQMNTDEHSAASEAATKPDVTADERRWTQIESRPEPEHCIAGGGT